MRENYALQKLRAGEVAVGTFVMEFATVGLPRTVASTGMDFLVLDLEHSGHGREMLRSVLSAARSAPIAPFVRVPSVDPHAVSLALDLGALGVIVPRVESPEEAGVVVAAAHYPPGGRRGFGILYVDEHDGDVAGYMRDANREIAVIVQIESAGALERVDEIAAVEGVDALWVGQYDLTASLGIPGDFDHPRFLEALAAVVAACRQQGKAAAMATDDLDHAKRLLDQGFRCLAYGHDLTLYRRALSEGIESLCAALPESQ